MATTNLSAARLRELLHYDPETGIFTRLVSRKGTGPVGSVAGSMFQHGYLKIGVDGPQWYSHRLAWLYMTGEWPTKQIDHRDGNRTNNAFSNLRDVSATTNGENKRAAQSNSKSGVLGVCWNRQYRKWVAQIRTDGGYFYLGRFSSKEAAREAYLSAKRRLHEGNTL